MKLHDGSRIVLRKLEESYDPTDRVRAGNVITQTRHSEQVLTGLLYINTEIPNLKDTLSLVEKPLSQLEEAELRPSRQTLEAFNQTNRV